MAGSGVVAMRTTGREVHVLRDYEGHGLVFLQGGRYVVEDPTLGHLLMMGIAGESELRNHPPGDGNRVLVTRSGGFGDLLFLTPLLRTLVAQGKEVTVCCHGKYREALSGVPVEWCPYPMFSSDVNTYDQELWMEGIIEFAEKPEVHAVDLFAEAARTELTEGKELSFAVQDADRAWAELKFPKKGKRVGVQLMASSPARTYPKEMMVEVIRRLLEKGDTEIALFGAPGTVQLEAEHPLILNVASKAERFGQSAAVLEQCEVVLAPDSAIAHLAGALRLPTIALYGPFPWQARTAYAPTVRALTGVLRCAPCYWHGRGGPYPPDGPCSITGRCEALAQLEPERVVREVRKYL
jgi:ADP-heptose:LPS heptosyltransferase